jgi:hypothetical protein
VEGALLAVEASGDTAEVALKLAQRIDADGASPSTVRELRYALLALGVSDLAPFVALMRATKAAIDSSDESLPTLAAQLREQEQTVRKLSHDPVNAPASREVREAVDGLLELWRQRWREWRAGVDRGWSEHHARSVRLWSVINGAGGEDAFPAECDRAGSGFEAYWQGRRFRIDADELPLGREWPRRRRRFG